MNSLINKRDMRQNIEKFVKIVYYLTFFVPLVVIPASFIFPFIVPKILIFRSLVLIMLGCYGLLLYINWQEYKPKFTALNIALALFLFSFAVSTFAGADPYHSFWDNHERMLGLFTITHYVLYYFIGTAVFKNWKDWRLLMQIFLGAGSIVMLFAVMQIGNPNFLLNQGSNRTASTLGNSIYVSGYGLFLMFTSALLFFREKSRNWKIAYCLSASAGLVGLIFGGSRGALLGLLAGIGIAVLGYILVLKEYPRTRLALGGIILFVVLLGGVLFANRQSSLVMSIPAFGRILNTTSAELFEGPRMIAWTIAYESWKERPVFGWGPNNFFYAFNKYYNPRSLEFGYGETWFDNAHNIIMNTLTVQGLFGLLIYLSIFGFGIFSLFIAYKKTGLDKHIFVLGSAFLVAHFVQNVTVFENPTSYLYFMVWLAMVNRMTMNKKGDLADEKNENAKADRSIGWGMVNSAGVVVFILIFIFNIQPARANMKTLDALQKLSSNPIIGVSSAKSALEFNSPHIDDIRSDIGRISSQLLSNYQQQLGKERSNAVMLMIYPELQKNLILHPLDIRNQLSLAQLAQIGYIIDNNPKYIMEANNYLESALTHSPKRQQVLYSLASIKMQMGDSQKAIKLLEQAMNDNPKIGESYWRLASVYQMAGQNNKAKEIIDLAKKNNIKFDSQGQQAIQQVQDLINSSTLNNKKK